MEEMQGNIDRLQTSIEALTRDVADTAATVRSLAGSVGMIAQRQDRLETVQQAANRLNWAPVAIMASVVVSVATISGGLIAYAISSEADSRVTGDNHIESQFAAILAERTETDTAQRDGVMQASDFRHQITERDVERIDGDLEELGHRLDRIAERGIEETARLDAELAQRFADIDAVLQREMRLLDEILQREMGLHVERLDGMIRMMMERTERLEDKILKEGNP